MAYRSTKPMYYCIRFQFDCATMPGRSSVHRRLNFAVIYQQRMRPHCYLIDCRYLHCPKPWRFQWNSWYFPFLLLLRLLPATDMQSMTLGRANERIEARGLNWHTPVDDFPRVRIDLRCRLCEFALVTVAESGIPLIRKVKKIYSKWVNGTAQFVMINSMRMEKAALFDAVVHFASNTFFRSQYFFSLAVLLSLMPRPSIVATSYQSHSNKFRAHASNHKYWRRKRIRRLYYLIASIPRQICHMQTAWSEWEWDKHFSTQRTIYIINKSTPTAPLKTIVVQYRTKCKHYATNDLIIMYGVDIFVYLLMQRIKKNSC